MTELTVSAQASAYRSAIDDKAPVVAVAEIAIASAPAAVWDVLTNVDRWPSWNPEVKSAAAPRVLSQGSEFRWKAGPGTITSIIQRVDPPHTIVWTGRTMGLRAVHAYRLEPRAGGTIVRTEESYGGLVARIFRGPLQKMLNGSLERGLQHLKAEMER